MNFNAVLGSLDPNVTAAIITATVALIVGATTALLFWWASSKQGKQHEEKMKLADTKIEIQRLQLLKAISTLNATQEEKLKKLLNLKEDLETKIKLI